MPSVHFGVAIALVGAVLFTVGFLLSPFVLAIIVVIVVPLVLRGFSQPPD
jgi:hypothetical protein